MAVNEIDSFVNKFKSLLSSGHQVRLTFNSRKGKVWANLNVGLDLPLQPHHDGHHVKGHENARQRRKVRRAAARAAAVAATVTEEVTEIADDDADVNPKVPGAPAEEVTAYEANQVDAEHPDTILKDEMCSDAEYAKDTSDTLVDSILLSPDCQTGWKNDYITKLIDEKLKAIDLKMKNIQINRSNSGPHRGSFTSCRVTIEEVPRKKIEESDFSTRNRSWTLKIM